jgi:general secretion pathway protein F
MKIQANVVEGRGVPRSLILDAATIEEGRERLRAQGLTVLDCREVGFAVSRLLRPKNGEPRIEIVVFVEQLRDLLRAGLSVIEALDTLRQAADGKKSGALVALTERLRHGQMLSQALAADPQFSVLLVSLVRAAEVTSDLPQALTRFLEHEQRVAELRHRIVSVAIYPVLLMAVGAGVLLFLLLYVMPRFARVFEGMSGTLPWSARAMVHWAHWLHGHGALLMVAGVSVLLATAAALSSGALREQAMRRLLTWALLRSRLQTYFLARWYRATGMLVTGGIPLPEALALSNGLLPAGLRRGGDAVVNALREGVSPARAHAQAGMVTPVAEQLMRAGERTGDLGNVLTRVAEFHDAEVTRALERGMRTLEPVAMVLIGVGVGAVVVLMYMPIFELASAIQ